MKKLPHLELGFSPDPAWHKLTFNESDHVTLDLVTPGDLFARPTLATFNLIQKTLVKSLDQFLGTRRRGGHDSYLEIVEGRRLYAR
jgi:hypothetical protein